MEFLPEVTRVFFPYKTTFASKKEDKGLVWREKYVLAILYEEKKVLSSHLVCTNCEADLVLWIVGLITNKSMIHIQHSSCFVITYLVKCRCIVTIDLCQCLLLLTNLAPSIPYPVKRPMMTMVSSFLVFAGDKSQICFLLPIPVDALKCYKWFEE